MADSAGPIRSPGTNKSSFPRRLLRPIAWLVLLVLLGYGASNLWLMSRWGRGVVEDKLTERTGLEWSVGSISWSPWNGITVSNARMLQPEELRDQLESPVVSVERIRVKPYWIRLLGGGMRPREISVESPQIMVAVEMLASMQAGMAAPQVTKPPPGPPAPAAPPAQPVKPPGPQLAGRDEKPSPPKNDPRPPAQPDLKRPPAGLPMNLRVNNASVRIVSLGKDAELLCVERASFDMPVYGEDSDGEIRLDSIKVPGLPELVGIGQSVVWKRPFLELENKEVDVGGVKLQFRAQLGMGRSLGGKVPFFFDVVIPTQKVESVQWFERVALNVGAGKLAGKLRVFGLSASPGTWRADLLVLGENVSVKEEHGGHHVVFDELYLPALFRQGQLYWSGVRMVGEDLSVLGNGRISQRDGVLCVTRLVVSPELAQGLAKGLHGVGVPAVGWWQNLDTPDRKVRDLTVSGSLSDPVVDAGRGHAGMPLQDMLGSVFDFIRKEMKEEGKGLESFPNKGHVNGKRHENH